MIFFVRWTKEKCQLAFDTLCSLLCDLWFQLRSPKLVSPYQSLVFLCVYLDIIGLTVSLPSVKLQGLQTTVAEFLNKKRATKRQLQNLVGCLNWACKVRRVLDHMNTLSQPHSQCACHWSSMLICSGSKIFFRSSMVILLWTSVYYLFAYRRMHIRYWCFLWGWLALFACSNRCASISRRTFVMGPALG